MILIRHSEQRQLVVNFMRIHSTRINKQKENLEGEASHHIIEVNT